MTRIKSHAQTEWALSQDAQRALAELEKAGWDRDLALATLEAACGAESLFALEESEESEDE